jgi:RHS repeat-associated protein
LGESAGVVRVALRYDAFGNAAVPAAGPWAADNPFGYRGERFDPTLGHYYLRARTYDPRTGRFTSRDAFSGDLADPLSLHKYAYAHNDPVTNFDPTGLFAIAGFVGAFTSQMNLRGSSAPATVNTLQTANQVRRLAKIYNKVIKLYEKVEDVVTTIMDIIDILDFSLNDLQDIVKNMSGLDAIASNLPATRKTVKFDLPKNAVKKFQKLASMVGGKATQQQASEMVGEFATGLMIHLMGFTQVPTNWNWSPKKNNGPDNVAKHSNGVWGIFEAKGGHAPLKSNALGGEMSGGWLDFWIKEIYNKYSGPWATELKKAFTFKKPMLAAIVRYDYLSKNDPQIIIAVQKYTPPQGIGDWGKKLHDY